MGYPAGSYSSGQPGAYSDYTQWVAEPETDTKVSHRSLTLAVAILGLSSYLVSFGPMLGVAGIDWDVRFPVLAGLLAAFGLLPRQTPAGKVIAALAAVGFLDALSRGIVLPEGVEPGWALWVLVLLNAAQTAVAVAALRNQPAPADAQQAWYAAYAEQYAQAAAQYYGQYDEDEAPGKDDRAGTAQAPAVAAQRPPAAAQAGSYEDYLPRAEQAGFAGRPHRQASPGHESGSLPNVGQAAGPAPQPTAAIEQYRTSSPQ